MVFTSILFPGQHPAKVTGLAPPDCFADLHLDKIVTAIATGPADEGVQDFYYLPQHDVSTITYRHEVFRDLDEDRIRRAVEEFAAGMGTLRQRLHQAKHLYHPLQQQGWFSYAVEAYCDATTTLRNALARVRPRSQGLRQFADYLDGYVDGAAFRQLSSDTESVQAELRGVRYVVHITGPRVHVEKFEDQTDYSIQVAGTFERFVVDAGKARHAYDDDSASMSHVEELILDRVTKLYPAPFRQLADFCTRNAHCIDPVISGFDREIQFYLRYSAFIGRFTAAGLAFSYPEATTEPGVMHADEAYDLALALKSINDGEAVVGNDFALTGTERILVVTGPNQGGKTTYARTIGQCLYLAALGCPVPAARAAFTVPDRIYTHFERQETLATLHGKLDDELVRIHEILSRATATSVIVMNESFASTTVDDALLIGAEVLQRLIKLGCVTVYVTFLDELANRGSPCVSMVGEVAPDDPTRRTFRFTRRRADGLAYAAALAVKYRLDHDVLRRRITR